MGSLLRRKIVVDSFQEQLAEWRDVHAGYAAQHTVVRMVALQAEIGFEGLGLVRYSV